MPIISPEALRQFAAETLSLAGSSEAEARQVAANLVEADLQGHGSHGVGMIPRYIAAIRENGLRPNSSARLISDLGAILNFDGQMGYGQIVGAQAIAAGITRASQTGVAIVSLANAHHLGRIGAWAEQCAEAGLVSLHFVNVCSRPIVVPWGGTQPKLGTNPICIGFPRPGTEALILDFATSAIAAGKARLAYNKGETLKPGLAVDDQGQPTTAPRFIITPPFGGLLPFGEHKGGGLALISSLLGAALTGSPTERVSDASVMTIVNGMLSIILNPAMLGGADSWNAESASLLDWATAGHGEDAEMQYPGDPERRTKTSRLAEGIPVDEATWAELQAARESVKSLGNGG